MPPPLMFFWEIWELFTGAEAATGSECFVKTMFLKISQYSQKNACVGVIFLTKFLKAAAFGTADLLKKSLQHRCFSVNIVNFLKTRIIKNICKGLFLKKNYFCIGSFNKCSLFINRL